MQSQWWRFYLIYVGISFALIAGAGTLYIFWKAHPCYCVPGG